MAKCLKVQIVQLVVDLGVPRSNRGGGTTLLTCGPLQLRLTARKLLATRVPSDPLGRWDFGR
jgi:hypothetical protein